MKTQKIYEEVAKICDISFEDVREDIELILEFSKSRDEMTIDDTVDFVVRSAKQKQLLPPL